MEGHVCYSQFTCLFLPQARKLGGEIQRGIWRVPATDKEV